MLEARLLTNASFAEIAHGFATEPKAIEYFEALFFNVRDRLSNTDWINKVIRGEFGAAQDGGRLELAAEDRGYVLRLFAFYGGPHVLETMIHGMIARPLSPGGDVGGWLQAVLGDVLSVRSAAAAATLMLRERNAIRLMKLAGRLQRSTPTAARAAKKFEAGTENLVAS